MGHYRTTRGLVKSASAVAALLLASAIAGACANDASDDVDRRLAESYLRNAPTFRYDGIAESVEFRGATSGECPGCRAYAFHFQSAGPGYGDRSALALEREITPHAATIVIQDGLVVAANVDGVWDVTTQTPMAARSMPGDASAGPVDAALDAPFELRLGQEAVFGEERLRVAFLEVTEDSRCPTATVCASVGLARARLEIVEADQSLGVHEFVIGQPPLGASVGVGKWSLSVRGLNLDGSGDARRYAAILVVRKTLAA